VELACLVELLQWSFTTRQFCGHNHNNQINKEVANVNHHIHVVLFASNMYFQVYGILEFEV
jgi:hypothetical protein